MDVQRNHFWGVVRSWAADGRSRLVARAKLLTVPEVEAFADEHGVLRGQWWESLGVNGLPVVTCESRVFVDSKFNTQEVFRICSESGFHAVNSYTRRSYKHSDGVHRIYSEPHVIDSYIGIRREGSVRRVLQFFFGADAAKDRMEVLRSQRDKDGVPVWSAAANHGDEYARQIAAEAKVKTFKADGKTWAYK